ncbi:MAG: hypothetical protein JW717_11890 [Marinilabiliaceae bacterium]|nr:hypothetical protein [Marinilabiliaceae bacterium]
MTSEERIKKQKELVEIIGIHFDKEGFQPIAGRILGLLMVMDKEQYSFDEIVEELQISKSSASNALKILELKNSIEYITIPGDRKRYFQLKKLDVDQVIEDHKKKIEETLIFLEKIISLKADKNSSNSVFISKMVHLMSDMLIRLDESKYHGKQL